MWQKQLTISSKQTRKAIQGDDWLYFKVTELELVAWNSPKSFFDFLTWVLSPP
jgi:hypothetical protein